MSGGPAKVANQLEQTRRIMSQVLNVRLLPGFSERPCPACPPPPQSLSRPAAHWDRRSSCRSFQAADRLQDASHDATSPGFLLGGAARDIEPVFGGR